MVAHPLGRGVQHMILLSSCLRIAQCLGLAEQKPFYIDNSADESSSRPGPHLSFRISEEVIRRVWWQLLVQDYFLVPMAGSYGKPKA